MRRSRQAPKRERERDRERSFKFKPEDSEVLKVDEELHPRVSAFAYPCIYPLVKKAYILSL